MNWLIENKEWIFSGIGVSVLSIFLGFLFKKKMNSSQTNAVVNNTNIQFLQISKENKLKQSCDPNKIKVHILFVDDQTFKVVEIMRKSGWQNTKRIKDVTSYDMPEIIDADILFIDVQGVGLAMKCKDEGLGLSLNLKDKYPNKKIIIYSAETSGDRFHDALRKADDFLPKNAEPYQFIQIVEEFAAEINNAKSGS